MGDSIINEIQKVEMEYFEKTGKFDLEAHKGAVVKLSAILDGKLKEEEKKKAEEWLGRHKNEIKVLTQKMLAIEAVKKIGELMDDVDKATN